MSSFLKASKVFATTFNTQEYFESLSAEFTKSSLITTIESKETPLLFLLGEPGVGKTYMLHLLKEHFSDQFLLFSTEPFSTPESFLHFLLQERDYDPNMSLTELKNLTTEYFKEFSNHLIVIDEAQLLHDSVLEFIRILSDTGHFNFLLSMHKKEGDAIVKKSHFASRTHRVITLGFLEVAEIQRYIEAQLLSHELGNLSELFSKKQTKLIAKFSEGNFRVVKQLLKHIFSIMDYAKSNGHDKYITPTPCVITMAAIDLGIIDA
ncbi:MAG: ATP-binding protein [Campylobacterota bacterium]|nr:ATP-binding protein [Campylobacterota bacterium]